MELYFNKPIQNCCKLNFSNRILQSPKPNEDLNQQKFKQIHFDKKKQKRSLKRVLSDHKTLSVRNPTFQIAQVQKKDNLHLHKLSQLDDYGYYQIKCDRNNQIDKNNKIINKQQIQKTRLCKSLQNEPHIRGINHNTRLYNWKNQRNNQHIQIMKPPKIQHIDPIYNQKYFNESTESFQKINYNKKVVQPIKIASNPLSTNMLSASISFNEQQKNQPFKKRLVNVVHFNSQSPINILPIKQNNQIKYMNQNGFSNSQPLKFSSNKGIQRINFNNQNIHNNNLQNDYFLNQQISHFYNPSSQKGQYSENFKKMYGQVELQQQIKTDLMRSLQTELDFYGNKNSPQKVDSKIISNQTSTNGIKITPSVSSTMIPSEYKFQNRRQFQNQYFDNQSFDRKKLNFSNNFYTKKIQNNEKSMVTFQKQNQTINFNQYQQRNETHLSNMQKQLFHEKCRRRQKFKSIISVNSQHQSSESVDSIILEKHPQELLISQPLKTLW